MDPTTAAYVAEVSTSGFPIIGSKYVGVDSGFRIRNNSSDR